MKNKKILVTGTAGFIGFHLAKRLLEEGYEVVGLDNINDYYDVRLKYARLKETGIEQSEIEYGKPVQSKIYEKYCFVKLNLEDRPALENLFLTEKFDVVCNLAAQAGVRYSIENPYAYIDSNIVGFMNILECCRHNAIQHLVYASSSSVYGNSDKIPFSENDRVDYPISLYAATKKANELMAHTYSHLYQLPTTGLRFFTVYGPWGRPDMAPMLFAKAITEGKPIKVFNNGDLSRDFTYIDDIVEGITRVMQAIPTEEEEHPFYRIFNIGNSQPVRLMEFIKTMEEAIGKKAVLEMYPMQQGDVKTTYANTTELEKAVGYKPKTELKDGVKVFTEWYKNSNL
ncbi:NAD-dependent epimerase [Bacteroidia bacterium]|nr:NAD-dependent epimerase [Bacteroidia bacterium]GHT85917.1 NAD-dependent epimerase [Bacteroidia bacterium]GHU82965.1 NAD-dependent epimerase [Bacteroidia bacterium]